MQNQETEAGAHGHGLAIVETGMWRPVWVADVGFVEVGGEGADDVRDGAEC